MKIFQFIRFLKAIINTIFGRGAILLLPVLPAVASCQHSAFFNAGDPLLLDNVTGAVAAFSVRQLSSTYTGSAVEVRRASDSTTQNIGFEGGQIDLGALTSFCSGTNCFVRTWYDQSGTGNHAVQTTVANQPKIYDSVLGVTTRNNKPTVIFDGSNDFFPFTTDSTISTVISVFSMNTSGVYSGLFSFRTSAALLPPSNESLLINEVPSVGKIYASPAHYAFINSNEVNYTNFRTFNIGEPLLPASFLNVVSLIDTTTAIGTKNIAVMADVFSASRFMNGRLSEMIFFKDNQLSNRLAIETNVNNFFSIY